MNILYNKEVTLTQTANFTKRAIIVFFVTIFLGLLGFTGYRIWINYKIAHTPPVEEKPDLKYGLLPRLDFTGNKASSSNFTYALDTTTGGLPSFDKLIKVYFISKAAATFLSSDRSQNLASKFNLKSDPIVLSEVKYSFVDNTRSLSVDLDTGNFSYITQASPSAQSLLQDDKKLVENFKNFLSFVGVSKQELANGPSKLQYFKFSGNNLIATSSFTDAQAAQISLWPEKIDDKPILTPDFNRSLITATALGSAQDINDYVLLNFTFWPVDKTSFSTYPMKNANQAFEDLKLGKGAVLIVPSGKQVSITSVYLAYYEENSYSPYLEPVFVFEGSSFVALIPAIADQYISQTK